MATISVTNITKTEQYELNGVCRNVADAVSKFTNGAGFRGVVKVGGVEIPAAERTAFTLRANDVVFLLNEQVAGGDLKGAL